jgi:hypothetical protein
MASTYEKIATTTLGSAAASVTFSSISSAYTDLVVVCAVAASSGGFAKLTFNNDTATNYSTTLLEGDGSGAYSARTSNTSYITIAGGNSLNYGANQSPTLMNISVQNYSNATTNKTILCRTNNQATSSLFSTYAYVGLWRNTSAINRLDITPSAGNWNSGSTFTIYGIKAA